MAETMTPEDVRQLLAHLESLRLAGLADLPRVEIAAEAIASLEPQRVEVKPQARNMPIVDHKTDPRPTKPVGDVIAVETVSEKPTTERPPAAAGEPGTTALPGMNEPRSPRRQPPPAARPAAAPVASFFGQARVPIESPVVPAEKRPELLRVLAEEVEACTRCPHLAATRTQTVFHSGSPNARLMFIGEAPGADEDRLGEPFVGRAGQLLTDIVSKGMGLSRSEIYIANVLKCRPPENRNPLPDEMANCRGFLDRQIEIVRPEFICLLGKVAVGAILETSLPMKSLRQRWHRYREIPTIVTWHPAYLLRTPSAKKDTWEDIQMLMTEMGLKPPKPS